MATSAMSIHTPSGNRNAESVNTHENIPLVAILEELLIRWQLIQAETIDTITKLFSRQSRLHVNI